MAEKVKLTDQEWRQRLTPEQFRILREKGTEPPFINMFVNEKSDGIYRCAACGNPLFSSETKYDSRSGWPSFWEPISPDAVRFEEDRSFGMVRIEVLCARCDGHLGHLFDDGPNPTGMRYCMNSLAMDLDRNETSDES
jgi:peptide-methionine (R)-S-oxide reductase